ncbi:MAG: zf-HC2 domain-containing protein [candidate division Zixibacteria bacterium]|nr:zf-HC2 domain-containing protein [Candidatus Tariuqbacter arcticus]
MKDCEQYQMNLSAMLDGELSDAELTKTVRHLAECESCMAEFQRFQNLQARVDEEYAVEQVPKTAWKDIHRLERKKRG